MDERIWTGRWARVVLVSVLVLAALPAVLAGAAAPPGPAPGDGEEDAGPDEVLCHLKDWGDAPGTLAAPRYPTLAAHYGAWHWIDSTTPNPFLGARVDADDDGQPEAHAQGDDYNDEGDDEDGVCFCASPVVWGQSATVDVEVGGRSCYVNAWIDFNGSGGWGGPGEQIITDSSLASGSVHYVPFTVPSGSGWLVTYSRFRCSTQTRYAGSYTYKDSAPDGEVEDHELVINDVPVEFGDLPDGYGTTLGQGGAYHFVVDGFYLGFSVDGEGNGNPSNGANGDDTCPPGGDDEDGVILPSTLTPGGTACVDVYLTNTDASRKGVLDAWMDFDANGWDPGDQIITGYLLADNAWTQICFAVPLRGLPGDPGGLAPPGTPIYSRFRLSEQAVGSGAAARAAPDEVNDPTGPGGNGELEDYTLSAPTAVTVMLFTAAQSGESVLLQWQTETEIDNLGFNLLRAGTVGGERVRLNAELIPSLVLPGSPVGSTYEFVDGTVEPGVEYDYWLETVDLTGEVELHGPARAGLLTFEIDKDLWEQPVDVATEGD